MSRTGIESLKIQTYVLKVHIHCHGCQKKVKKLLRKIEGVYSVNIDADNQVVLVTGDVDSAILVRRLAKSGKYAELRSLKDQIPNQGRNDLITDDISRTNGLNALKAQQILPNFIGDKNRQDQWSLENYLNQNIGMDGQNTMAATESGDTHMGNYGNMLGLENRSMMIDNAGFQGNDLGFVGYRDGEFGGFQEFGPMRPRCDYEYPRPTMMNGFQNLYHYNHPATETVHNNNLIFNQNYKHQPYWTDYRSFLIPPYKDFGFSYAPRSFY